MSSYLFGEKAATFSEDFLDRTVERIERLAFDKRSKGLNSVVAICGGSCIGKSTIISKGIMNRLSIPFTFLDQDTFQNNASYLKNPDQKYRWDHPCNFSIEECIQALIQLKDDKMVTVPDYSFKTDKPIGERQLVPNSLILFEGIYASFKHLSNEADITIYGEAPFYVRLIRRIFRNTLERYKGRDPALILKGFISSVTEAHKDFVYSQRMNADVVVRMPFAFSDLIKRFSLSPIEGEVGFDWHIDFQDDLKITLHRNSIFALTYEEKKYLEFEIDGHSATRLKELDWFAL